MQKKRSKNMSWVASCVLHLLIIGFLVFTIERTIIVPPTPGNENKKEIIDAVMINKESLQKEVARLDNIEKRKKADEQKRQQDIVRKENEAKLKREKEEALLVELKEKNEKLKKEAIAQKALKVKEEKERKEKLKAEKEELKKLKKEKEAAVAAKAKDDENVAKKKAEVDQESSQNMQVNQDAIMQHSRLLMQAINRNWRQPMGMNISGLKCQITVRLMITGDVVEAHVIKSSGSLEFDRSAELAIQKASPLPMPSDPATAKAFKDFEFTFDPEAA